MTHFVVGRANVLNTRGVSSARLKAVLFLNWSSQKLLGLEMTNCALLWLFKQIVRGLFYLPAFAPTPRLILNFTGFQAFRKCLISSSISTLQFPLGKYYFTANKCLFQSFLVGTRHRLPCTTISRLCSNKDVLKLLMTPTGGGGGDHLQANTIINLKYSCHTATLVTRSILHSIYCYK